MNPEMLKFIVASALLIAFVAVSQTSSPAAVLARAFRSVHQRRTLSRMVFAHEQEIMKLEAEIAMTRIAGAANQEILRIVRSVNDA